MASTASAWKIGFFGKGYGRTFRTEQESLDSAGEGRVDSKEPSISEDFAKRMVPFYAQCLIEVEFPALEFCAPVSLTIPLLQNSVQGRLSTPQLRLAYSTLVRSACVSAYEYDGLPDETYSLAWYCVQLILDKLRDLTSPAAHDVKGKGKAARDDVKVEDRSVERIHRLRLVLISMVSSLPLLLMSRVLEEIRIIILTQPADSDEESAAGRRRKELVEALFAEFLEGVGDREKEAAIRWWYQHRPMLISGREEEKGEEEGTGTVVGSWMKGVKKDLKDAVNEELGRSDAARDQGVVSRL